MSYDVGMARDAALDALGDASRREILRLLAEGEQPVHALASQLPVSRPAVSRHLRVLADAGLVAARAEGTRRLYRLEATGPAAVRSYLEEVWGQGMARFALVAENVPGDERVAEAGEVSDGETEGGG
jgi:DNA-binding transcriptional ArsR family regulator